MGFGISFVSPLGNSLGALGDLFGSGNYSQVGLLDLQMQMLKNIGQKVDVIKSEIDVLFSETIDLANQLKAVPPTTVSQLYEQDLQGLFLLLDELMSAYAMEAKGVPTPTRAQVQQAITDVTGELRIARAKLFTISDEHFAPLILPIAGMCLHYEVACLITTQQPASLLETTLDAYQKYFDGCVNGTSFSIASNYQNQKAQQDKTVGQIDAAVADLPNYTACSIQIPGEFNNFIAGQNPPDNWGYVQQWTYDKARQASTNTVLEDMLITFGLLVVDDVAFAITPRKVDGVHAVLAVGNGSLSTPYTVAPGFDVKASQFELTHAGACPAPQTPPGLGLPGAVTTLVAAQNSQATELIIYASLLQLARNGIAAVDQIRSNQPAQDAADEGQSFDGDLQYVAQLCGQRSAQWTDLIAAKSDQVPAQNQATVANLTAKMTELQKQAGDILSQYAAAEADLKNSLPPTLLGLANGLIRPLGDALSDLVTGIGRETRKLVHDVEWNLAKAGGDAAAELGRDANNLAVAVNAAVNFVEAQMASEAKALEKSLQEARQGRIFDAAWNAVQSDFNDTQKNAYAAFQKSSFLRDLASSAAAAYGGPAGAAAFAAWYCYKTTGDLTAALKAGVITGLTAEGMQLTGDVPDLTQRTALTAAIGAAAIAAAGGSEQDVIRGVLTGAAYSLASNEYQAMTEHPLDGRAPTDGWINKDDPDMLDKYGVFKDANGNDVFAWDKAKEQYVPQIDTNNIPWTINQVGIANSLDGENSIFTSESSYLMQVFADVPYMNGMARFHDAWCALQDFEAAEVPATIVPAMVLTLAASPVPIERDILNAINAYAAKPLDQRQPLPHERQPAAGAAAGVANHG